MKRRQFLTMAATTVTVGGGLAWQTSLAQISVDIPALLRKGGCALMLRHAQTEPGVGDPPGYRLDQCRTQRNLSDEGRQQAKSTGQWFKEKGLQPQSVQTSAWCRCKDTAELVFGHAVVLGALGSTFDNRDLQARQTQDLRVRLKNIPAGQFEVWVTHQVNITALTGEVPAMGEAIVVNSKGQPLGRTLFKS